MAGNGHSFVLGGIGVLAVFVWAGYMRSPRQHPHVSASELHYIEQGGALVDIDAAQTRARPPVSKAMFKTLLTNRMLWCAYLGQYCTIALSYFFITGSPIYLVQARGMNILDAGFATIAPALFGFLGGISGGYISDKLLARGWSLSWARKTPYIVGMLMAASLILAAVIPSNAGIIAIMSFAFFGKGVAAGAGTWTVVSDTAPKEAVGLAGAIFNGIGNMAGFITPLLFGVIVRPAATALAVFVGAHCVVAALLFLLVMGPIERVGDRHNAAAATEEKTAQKAGIKVA